MLLEFKPGFCPTPNQIGQLCAFMCSSDSNCADDLKCCTNACGGTQCAKPQKSLVKAGDCPVTGDDFFGICVHGCDDDSSCSGDLKCCSNGCGTECKVAV